MLPQLPRGKFVVVQPDPSGVPCAHVSRGGARDDARAAREEVRRFAGDSGAALLLPRHHGRVAAAAESLHDFRHAVVAVPDDVLGYHAARGDFSRWVLDVFADREVARQLEKSVARWRPAEIRDLGRAIDRLILNRYGPEGWPETLREGNLPARDRRAEGHRAGQEVASLVNHDPMRQPGHPPLAIEDFQQPSDEQWFVFLGSGRHVQHVAQVRVRQHSLRVLAVHRLAATSASLPR